MGINLVRISGKVICDYIWCTNRALTQDEHKFVSDPHNEPPWTKETALLVTFNESLLAGNITNGAASPIMRIYRSDIQKGTMDLAAVTDGIATSVVDYNVVNNKDYEYILFAESEGAGAITLPITSPTVKTSWRNYCLFDVDSTTEDNRYKIHECFLFEFNMSSGTISNNLIVSKYDNFTRYPKFVKSIANYYSSTLTGLIGHLDEYGVYHDSSEMLDALSAFTASTRKKYLKDYKGHIWQVEISAPMQETAWDNYGGIDPYEVSIPWTECGSTKGVIIN